MIRALCLVTTFLLLPWTTVRASSSADSDVNAALYYWQAFATLPKFSEAENKIIGDCLVAPLNEASRKILVESEYSLSMLHRGTTLKHCDWAISFDKEGINVLLPHLAASRVLASLACLRARERFQTGENPDGAIDDLLAAMVLGRHISVDGSLLAVLVGYNIEYRAIETLAVELPSLGNKSVIDIKTRFDAMPPFGTQASALLACEKVTLEWFIRKVKETKDKEGLLTFLSWVGISEDSARDSNGKAATFLKDCGGTAEGVVKLAEKTLPTYDAMATILDLPLDEFEKEFAIESMKQAGNPVYNVFFPSLLKSHQAKVRADVRRSLFSAALAIKQEGQDALKNHLDPIGGGRFDFSPFKAGFELGSKMNGQDDKPITLMVGHPD